MMFTIITPTLQRESLRRCCESVESQTFTDWQHCVQADAEELSDLTFSLAHPKRIFGVCGERHNDFGNSCRHLAWQRAEGDWLIYLDDDNFLADSDVLSRIAQALEGRSEPWAIFPIMRHGLRFFYDPPGTCYFDTANMVVRREIGRWPKRAEYTLDGIFCEELKSQYAYAAFPNVNPIVVMEKSGEGK